MFVVQSYALAVVLCVVTMICWGSWGNTQKLASKSWRYELFYWDYVIGILLFSILTAFTLGSVGEGGRSFLNDISQVAPAAFWSAVLGGVIFNASNILLSASTSIAGMSVAFPVGVGLALALGVVNNYVLQPKGNPLLLFGGMALVIVAIVLNGIASSRKPKGEADSKNTRKGISLAVCAGVLMAFFYRFVAAAMDLENFESPAAGKATPYTAFFIFALGIFASNFIINTFCMKKPFVGEPVTYRQYFKGSMGTHLVGVLGGCIWGLGSVLSYISAGKAGAAISYALGQGAPMIAAIWGIFIWKEFKGSGKGTNALLALMFVFFIVGLACIVAAGNA